MKAIQEELWFIASITGILLVELGITALLVSAAQSPTAFRF